jgi:hypothetical protein
VPSLRSDRSEHPYSTTLLAAELVLLSQNRVEAKILDSSSLRSSE